MNEANLIPWIDQGAEFYRSAYFLAAEHVTSIPQPLEERHRFLMAMYMRGFELVDSITHLDARRQINSATILCRSYLELHIDFMLVLFDKDHYKTMRMNELPGEIALSTSCGEIELADSLLSEQRALKEEGFKKKSIQQKIRDLEKVDIGGNYLYDGFYRSLCIEAHNSSRSMFDAHSQKAEGGWVFGPGIGLSKSRYLVSRKQVGLTMCQMSALIHELLSTGKSLFFIELRNNYRNEVMVEENDT